jgi:hypothetical protein
MTRMVNMCAVAAIVSSVSAGGRRMAGMCVIASHRLSVSMMFVPGMCGSFGVFAVGYWSSSGRPLMMVLIRVRIMRLRSHQP